MMVAEKKMLCGRIILHDFKNFVILKKNNTHIMFDKQKLNVIYIVTQTVIMILLKFLSTNILITMDKLINNLVIFHVYNQLRE